MNSRGILIRMGRVLAALICLGISCRGWADPTSSAADEVRQVLEIGWKPSPENYDAARLHYEQAKAAAPGDVRAPYAMALVAIRNHQPKDAGEYLSEAATNGKPLLPIRRAKLFVDALEKYKEAAAADFKELIPLLAAADSSQNDAQETARWVGSVLGFLKGPGSGQLPADQVAALETEISGKLKGALGDAYAAGASQTANQYAQFQQQLAQAHQDAKARNETKLAEACKQNDAALEQAAQSRSSIEESYNKLQETYRQKSAMKRNELDQAQRDFTSLNVSINQMQNAMTSEQQKSAPQQNSAYLTQLNDSIKRANEGQAKLDQRARDIKAWFRSMDADDRSLSRELKKAQVLEDALTRKSNDLKKEKVTENDASTAALDGKAASLKTYVDFDLEQEKNRILHTYEQKSR